MLDTRPACTGSSPEVNTIGIVEVAFLAACAAGGPPAMSTAALRLIRSPISSGSRLYWPSAQRRSISTFLPSTKPLSSRPRRYAAAVATWACAELLLTNPTTGIADCCADAAKGQVAVPPSRVINSRRLIGPPRHNADIIPTYGNSLEAWG